MSKLDNDSEKIFDEWLSYLLPKDMKMKELEQLAKKAKLSSEALRKLKNRNRRGMSTDTLIRLALCRGATPKSLISALLQIENSKSLEQSEVEWVQYGANLEPGKRKKLLDFIKYMRKFWDL